MQETLRTAEWYSKIPQHWEIIKECHKNNQSQSHNKPNIVNDFNTLKYKARLSVPLSVPL